MHGKKLRLNRLFNPATNKALMLPMDHGTTLGPIEGLENYTSTIKAIVSGGVDALIVHKGILNRIAHLKELVPVGLLMHLSVSTILGPDANRKRLVGTVEEAIKLGADGVSIHVNLGTETESEMIEDLGYISREASEWGIPLLVMVYSQRPGHQAKDIMHAVRLAEELGADIIKSSYPGTKKELEKILSCINTPLLISGGEKSNNFVDILTMIDDVVQAGAAGLSMGRNIFQNSNLEIAASIVYKLVHGKISLQEAIDLCTCQ